MAQMVRGDLCAISRTLGKENPKESNFYKLPTGWIKPQEPILFAQKSNRLVDKTCLKNWDQDRPGMQMGRTAFVSLLRTFGNGKFLSDGKSVHDHIIKSGLERDPFLGNLLVQMYGKCGALEEARVLFVAMDTRDVFSWNAIIRAYTQQEKGLEAIRLFDLMQEDGLMPDRVTFVSVLAACTSDAMPVQGKRIHALIVKHGFETDFLLGTALVNMYGKCDSLEDTERIFDKMPERDVVTWTAMIAVYAQHDQGKKALELVDRMQREGLVPDKFTIVSILDACARHAFLIEGQQMHAYTMSCGLEKDVVVETALVNMYAKCDSLDDARRMFDKMCKRNVLSWTTMIGAYAHHGQCQQALELFDSMQQEGIMPDKVSCIGILDACVDVSALIHGKQVHSHILASEVELDVVIGTALVKMYGRSGSLDDARKLFDNLLKRDVFIWNTMIALCNQHCQGKLAFQLYAQMQQEVVMPTKLTFVSMLSTYASEAMLTPGKQMHASILGSGFELDLAVQTALIDMYAKCHWLEEARRVFDSMSEQDALSWNVMIGAYAQHGHSKQALQLFDQMKQVGVFPDNVTFVSTLVACACQRALTDGERLHACVLAGGFDSDAVIGNALVNLYSKCGRLKDTSRMFMRTSQRDLVAWTSMVAVHAEHGLKKEAHQLVCQMQQEGILLDKIAFVCILAACAGNGALAEGERLHARILCSGFESNAIVGTALISMYGKCGNTKGAWRVFHRMPEQDLLSWNAMIAAYVHSGQSKKALNLFKKLQEEGFRPDQSTFTSILSGCASQQIGIVEAKEMHVDILQGPCGSDVVVGSALVNLYGKCGSVEDAQRTFDAIYEKNVICWNAMIAVYAQHGKGEDALQLFSKMHQEMRPDKVTFINVLGACSHAGLVEEAHHCFSCMYKDHGILPVVDHYVCMIDVLGRAGRLDDAELFTENMPIQPTVVPFTALLGPCRYQGDVQRGYRFTNHVLELDSTDNAPFSLLSNVFTTAGSEDVSELIRSGRDRGLRSVPKLEYSA